MNTEALFLLLILILGLLLCSFLGGNCDKEGFNSNSSTQLQAGTTFTDPKGNTITVTNNNGGLGLQMTQVGQSTPTLFTTTPPAGTTVTANTFYATPPLKMTAIVITDSNGQPAIQVTLAGGQTDIFTQSTSSTSGSSTSGSSSSTSGSTSGSSTTSGYYDNYNHYNGTGSSSQLQTGTTFTDASGNNITVIVNSNGSQSLQITPVSQSTPILFTTTPPTGTTVTANTFYATPPLKMTAIVITDSNGQAAIQVTLANGQTDIFTQSGSTATTNSGSITSTQYYGSTGSPYQTGASNTSYTGAYGGSAGSVTGPNGNTAYYAQGPNGNSYYNGTSSTQYYGPYGGSAGSATGPNGNTYSNSLPPGIPASQIPAGQEDLYILKSQVVPPVCPVCPACNSSTGGNNDPDAEAKCPACPACARCPEPSFECKKVPNYNAINNSYLPQPIVNDFSSFGM